MIFGTYLFSYMCYPSIIIYKPLTFISWEDDSDALTRITELGVINVGSWLVSEAIGSTVTIYCLKEMEGLVKKKIVYAIIFSELVCTAVIYFIVLSDFTNHIMIFCFQNGLAIMHGIIAPYFMLKCPPLKEVPYNKQAQAYMQR